MSQPYVIIVAAGTGNRFGSSLPKQFHGLGAEGLPVLMHTVQAFRDFGISDSRVLVVLSREMFGFWNELCLKFNFNSPRVVAGGETRFHSVKNALNSVDFVQGDNVLIHDGARPLVSSSLIGRIVESLRTHRAVVPATAVSDSLRRMVNDEYSMPVNRAEFRAVQTPQGFDASMLKTLYRTEYKDIFTDDASIVDSFGMDVRTVEGDVTNIKITSPIDLVLAEAILQRRK